MEKNVIGGGPLVLTTIGRGDGQDGTEMEMAELVAAKNRMAFAKVGVYGFGGSGKTYTSALIAIGLLKANEARTKEKKKCAFFETEVGSDFAKRQFEEAGYELLVMYSRSFRDLLDFFDKAVAANCDVVIVDSVTHVWRDLVDGYLKAKGKKRLEMMDWDPLKKEWAKFTDQFLQSNLHAIICGRAGNVYSFQENDEGKKEVITVGTKMKAEGEFEYEPSLVIEMFKKDVEKEARAKTGDKVFEVACIVLKDRAHKLDSKMFIEPKYEDFQPHWDYLNIGGENISIGQSDTSEMFKKDGESYYQRKIKRERALEDISNIGTESGLGKTDAEKALKLQILRACFGTNNKVDLENTVSIDDLEEGVVVLRDAINEIVEIFRQSKDGKINVDAIADAHRERIRQMKLEEQGIFNDPDDIDDSGFGSDLKLTGPPTDEVINSVAGLLGEETVELMLGPQEKASIDPKPNDAPPAEAPVSEISETREPGDDVPEQGDLLKG